MYEKEKQKLSYTYHI